MFNHKLKINFRLYQAEDSKFKSTLFDLIDGDRETKHTKGLAYLDDLRSTYCGDKSTEWDISAQL
jgi:hypothetical protein